MQDRKQQPAPSPMGCSLFSRIPKSGTGCERSPGFGKRRSTSSCVTSHRPSSLLVESSPPSRFAASLLTEGRLFQWDLDAANRDPAVFTDPDHLDIGRKEGRILAL